MFIVFKVLSLALFCFSLIPNFNINKLIITTIYHSHSVSRKSFKIKYIFFYVLCFDELIETLKKCIISLNHLIEITFIFKWSKYERLKVHNYCDFMKLKFMLCVSQRQNIRRMKVSWVSAAEIRLMRADRPAEREMINILLFICQINVQLTESTLSTQGHQESAHRLTEQTLNSS